MTCCSLPHLKPCDHSPLPAKLSFTGILLFLVPSLTFPSIFIFPLSLLNTLFITFTSLYLCCWGFSFLSLFTSFSNCIQGGRLPGQGWEFLSCTSSPETSGRKGLQCFLYSKLALHALFFQHSSNIPALPIH